MKPIESFKLAAIVSTSVACAFFVQQFAHSEFSASPAIQISVGIAGSGAPEAPSGETLEPVAPSNGTFVVFASTAKNLTTDYPSGNGDFPTNIYHYSDADGVSLLSKGANGSLPKHDSSGAISLAPAVSELLPDGSYVVAYQSNGTNLVADYSKPDEFSNPSQIYLYSSKLQKNILISFREGAPTSGSSRNSYHPTVALISSAPIKYRVCFEGSAYDLLDGNATGASEFDTIFCRTIKLQEDSAIVGNADRLVEDPIGGSLHRPFLSQDGTALVFSSKATVVPEVSGNGFEQVYHHIFKTGAFSLVSRTQTEQAAKGDSTYPSTTHKGKFIAFRYNPTTIQEGAADLASLEDTKFPIIVLGNVRTGALSQVNTSAEGVKSNGTGYAGKIDSGSRFVAISDSGTNLLSAPNNSEQKVQVYIKDLKTSSLVLASKNSSDVEGSDNSGDNGDSINNSRQLPLTLVGTGAYKSSFMTSFISGADNLASVGDPDIYAPYLFASTVIIPPRQLINKTPIEAPANIEVLRTRRNGSQDIRISCEKFSLSSRASSAVFSGTARNRVRYRIEIRKRGSRQKIIRIRRRNRATIRRLAPGRYVIRYRVIARKGQREIRSRYSPRKTIVIS
jgi:hypothetical protein